MNKREYGNSLRVLTSAMLEPNPASRPSAMKVAMTVVNSGHVTLRTPALRIPIFEFSSEVEDVTPYHLSLPLPVPAKIPKLECSSPVLPTERAPVLACNAHIAINVHCRLLGALYRSGDTSSIIQIRVRLCYPVKVLRFLVNEDLLYRMMPYCYKCQGSFKIMEPTPGLPLEENRILASYNLTDGSSLEVDCVKTEF